MKELFKLNLVQDRVYGLDILRVFAIIFVLLHHCETLMPSSIFNILKIFLFDGVGVFFVLSGFLIGGILIKIIDKRVFDFEQLWSFWIKRWFRTMPNYFLILTILIIINYLFNNDFNPIRYLNYFLFSQNLYYNHPSFFPEAWSLSVEDWFYIITPLILFVLLKFKLLPVKKIILITVFFIFFSVVFYRYLKFTTLDIGEETKYSLRFGRQVFIRLDSLMFGVYGAYLYYFHKKFWKKHRLKFLVLGIVTLLLSKYLELFFFSPFYYCVLSFSVISLTTFLFLPYLSLLKSSRGIIYKIITYVSLTSYSIYLINFSLIKFWVLPNIDLVFLANINGYLYIIIRLLVYLGLTFIIAILLYKYFEIPTTKLRERFIKSKKNE